MVQQAAPSQAFQVHPTDRLLSHTANIDPAGKDGAGAEERGHHNMEWERSDQAALVVAALQQASNRQLLDENSSLPWPLICIRRVSVVFNHPSKVFRVPRYEP